MTVTAAPTREQVFELRPIVRENCGDGVVASATQSLNREINVVGATPKVSAAPLSPLDARRQGE